MSEAIDVLFLRGRLTFTKPNGEIDGPAAFGSRIVALGNILVRSLKLAGTVIVLAMLTHAIPQVHISKNVKPARKIVRLL